MSLHRFVFTLNYDLLTYWSAMASGPTSAIRDFFWSHQNTFDINNATLEEGGTGLFYVHGGVHLWRDSKSGRTGKWTKRSGGALLTSLEADFRSLPSRRPLLASEGTSAQKMAVIRRSDYLTYALQALSENISDTVIFGASFGEQDAHIIGAIASGRQRRIAISIHPGTRAQNDTAMAKYRARFPERRLAFFDSTSHDIAMTMQGRRVVTGRDENGDAVVVSDERLTAVSSGAGAGISGCEMWSTNRMPIDNSAAADAAQRAGFINHYIHANYVGTGAGTTFPITEFAPGHARFIHRTETADYVVVLPGTIDIYFETAFSSARAWWIWSYA